MRIIIIPFLLCFLFLIGKNICLLIGKEKFATIFGKLFRISFLTFWFGFLIFWNIYFIKEKNYFPLVFTIPFWIAGIYIMRKFLSGVNSKKEPKQIKSRFNFQIVVSSFLVLSVLVIGIVCLFFGIRDTYNLNKSNFLIYFGAFFTLGGSVFVLAALYIKGVFDNVKINIMGTYIGAVCIIIGIGIILFQNGTTSSFLDTIKSLGIWILIPISFVASGIYLTIKSLFFERKNNI